MRMEEAAFENKRIANERKKLSFFKARGNFKYHFTQNIKTAETDLHYAMTLIASS